MNKMQIISLGWGIQSFTMAAMSALGDLPPVDVAIHADTTHEKQMTYEFAQRWTPWLEQHGIRVETVVSKDAQTVKQVVSEWTDIPAFTTDGKSDGQLRRQCTHQWKIVCIRRWLQANRERHHVEQWIGISTDEALRMKPSDVKYITHRWPLIEKRMSRIACVIWLQKHGLEVPPKSACVFCPYHDTRSWQELKMRDGNDWKKAVDVDREIRKVRPPYDLFLHPSRKPLDSIDLRTDEQRGQYRLWDSECTGICGV